MTDERNNQECAEFQSHLAELVGSGVDLSTHPHLANCEICRELLADLNTIAEAARQLLTAEEPPDELWENIQSAIKSDSGDNPAENRGSDQDGNQGC